MSASAAVPKDHPLMVAWEAYKLTEDYANTKKWAVFYEHVEGSLWAAFERGWKNGGGTEPFAANPVHAVCQSPETPECDMLEADSLDSNDPRAWRTLARKLERKARWLETRHSQGIVQSEGPEA